MQILKKLLISILLTGCTTQYEYFSERITPVYRRGYVAATSFQLLYKNKRYTVTNKHVCDVNRDIHNVFDTIMATGKYINVGKYRRKIIAIDTNHDICILEADESNVYFRLADSYLIGESIYLIGHPRGLDLTVREGSIISVNQGIFPWLVHRDYVPYMLISATSYPGNSGSPVLNSKYQIVGILFAGTPGYVTQGFVVPLESIKQFLKRVIK